jgi:anti-anti-sigma factor
VTASGELDLLAVPGLESRLLEARRHGEDRVVIGLAEVTFIDCAALRTLIAAQEQARSAGGWLKLEGPSPVVRRLLDVTGTAELFT